MNTDPLKTIYLTIKENRLPDFESLIALHPEFIHFVEGDSTLLHDAADFGVTTIAKALLDRGAKIDHFAEVGGTALQCAARNGHTEMVRFLLDRGATLYEKNVTPLLSAIYGDQPEMVKFLIDAGTDPHLVYTLADGSPINALGYARMYGRPMIERMLEEMGCAVDVQRPSPEDGSVASKTVEQRRREAIIDFMTARFGEVDKLAMGELLPLVDGMSLSIHVIRPNDANPNLVLFTTGMSDLPLTLPSGQESRRLGELVIQLPGSWPHPRTCDEEQWLWPIHWLRNLAYLPHSSGESYPHPATIISSADPPEPLGANTKLSCLLLLPDSGHVSQPLMLDGDQQIHFYNVVPIYTVERDFEVRHGLEKFLEKFRMMNNPFVVNLNRPSFVA